MEMEPQDTVKRPQEELEANGASREHTTVANGEPSPKRLKLDGTPEASQDATQKAPRPRVKGVAPIKEEYDTAVHPLHRSC